MKKVTIIITMVFTLFVLAVHCNAETNIALGVSYSYPTDWPGEPSGAWPDINNSLLTDGEVCGYPARWGVQVLEQGNEPFVVLNIDVGQDYSIEKLIVLASDGDEGWNENHLSSVSFYVKSDSSGAFPGAYSNGDAMGQADWSMTGVAVDKSNSIWVVDTGKISILGRYVSIVAVGDGSGVHGLSEIKVIKSNKPVFCGDAGTEYSVFDISGPYGVPDCHVNFYDFAVLAASWLDCTDPFIDECL